MSFLNIRLFSNLLILYICFSLSPCTLPTLLAQETENDNGGWPKELWIGGGINLSFQSRYLGPYPGNLFSFGVSPLVGYKPNSFFSFGPRLEFSYLTGRFDTSQGIAKYNAFNYGAGVFARAKFLRYFFGHVEYSLLSQEYATNITANKIETIRDWQDIFLVGLGYTSASDFSYEIYINYNLLQDKTTLDLPIIYRLGFTYNF